MCPDEAQRHQRFVSWLTEHRGIFLKVSRAYTADAQDQADLQQEMQLQVWRSLPAFRGESQPSTWVYRVCLNTALSWRREERRHRQRVQSADTTPEAPAPEARPGSAHEQTELLEQLYAAIRTLAPAERSLVLLALEGLSYREISDVTGLTENHVGVSLTRARAKLAERLKGVRDELE